MLNEIHDYALNGDNFAFETTLSGRAYARAIPEWQKLGFCVKLFFLSLQSPELAISRVRQRVKAGGHNIPEPVICRRFKMGLSNLDMLYKPLVDEWAVYDNSGEVPELLEESVKL